MRGGSAGPPAWSLVEESGGGESLVLQAWGKMSSAPRTYTLDIRIPGFSLLSPEAEAEAKAAQVCLMQRARQC